MLGSLPTLRASDPGLLTQPGNCDGSADRVTNVACSHRLVVSLYSPPFSCILRCCGDYASSDSSAAIALASTLDSLASFGVALFAPLRGACLGLFVT